MKKLILFFICWVFAGSIIYSAVKVNISFGNFRRVSGLFTADINAQIMPGQTWRVGSSNIRLDIATIPLNAFSVHPDNPAYNANPNINNNMSYGTMTTTSISGGSAVSLNIVWNTTGPDYMFTPGTYTLGSVRFNILDSGGCIKLTIRPTSVLQDSLTQLIYPADWTLTSDTICRTIYPGGLIISGNEIPKVFKLYNNYPNPFNPLTKIKFDIPKESFTSINIFDILGQNVSTLVNETIKPGKYEIDWDGSNFASGVYYYRLETEYFTDTKKMILVK